jgi:catechol 2,3-dioxygenase-like lactoylglutathione lyase family enzyme
VFDHVGLRVADRAASERFYRTVLEPLGIEPSHDNPDFIEWDDLALAAATPDRPVTRHLHIGFVARTREHAEAFWRTGVEAGYESDGAPGERPEYGADYYGAFLLDPDGNSAEAVHAGDSPQSGHIDHLWIGVRDLGASAAFYELIARHAGFRAERRPRRRQYRGATGATFSLLADGRQPTENLHLAFPAPNKRTVEEFHAAAVAAGYVSNGQPGERRQYHPGYYGAFVLDPDGNNIESVFHDRPVQTAADIITSG